jgi:hypothetical protein
MDRRNMESHRGCTKVSPGCKHCCAETFSERFRGVKGHAFEQGFGLRLVPERLSAPLEWKRPRSIFVNSMPDVFREKVEDGYVVRVAEVIVHMELAGDKKDPFEALALLRRDALPALSGDCSKSEEGKAFRRRST